MFDNITFLCPEQLQFMGCNADLLMRLSDRGYDISVGDFQSDGILYEACSMGKYGEVYCKFMPSSVRISGCVINKNGLCVDIDRTSFRGHDDALFYAVDLRQPHDIRLIAQKMRFILQQDSFDLFDVEKQNIHPRDMAKLLRILRNEQKMFNKDMDELLDMYEQRFVYHESADTDASGLTAKNEDC